MYQLQFTLNHSPNSTLYQAALGTQQMLMLEFNQVIDLKPLAQIGGLSVKLTQEMGMEIQAIDQNLIIIEDIITDNEKTQLLFIGEQYVIRNFNEQQFSTDLRLLYSAYSSLRKVYQYQDYDLINIFKSNGSLKVLDVGIKKTKTTSAVWRLAILLLKLYLPRQEFKPIKYMQYAQQCQYIQNILTKYNVIKNDLRIIGLMLDQNRPDWNMLGDMLTSQRSISNFRQSPSMINQYNYTMMRIQNNVRSRSRRQGRSLYEQQNKLNESVNQTLEVLSQVQQRQSQSNVQKNQNIAIINDSKRQSNRYIAPLKIPQSDYPKYKTQESYHKIDTPKILLRSDTFGSYVSNQYPQFQQTTTESDLASPQKPITPPSQQSPQSYQNNNKNNLFQKNVIRKQLPSFSLDESQDIETIILQEKNNPKENQTLVLKRSVHLKNRSSQISEEIQNVQAILLQENYEEEFDNYSKRYKQTIESINLIGKTVADCINVFDAYKNLWMMPLFIIFKRMYQLRLQVYEDLVVQSKNVWNLTHFQQYKESQSYIKLIEEMEQENNIVLNEVQQILTNCKSKINKLDKVNRTKIEPLLNLDQKSNLIDIAFVYLYAQIYQKVKSLDLNELLLQIQCSLIIMETAPYDIQLDYIKNKDRKEFYQETLDKLEELKQRIIQKGYTL